MAGTPGSKNDEEYGLSGNDPSNHPLRDAASSSSSPPESSGSSSNAAAAVSNSNFSEQEIEEASIHRDCYVLRGNILYPFRIRQVADNGDCLFEAIAESIELLPENLRNTIRDKVARKAGKQEFQEDEEAPKVTGAVLRKMAVQLLRNGIQREESSGEYIELANQELVALFDMADGYRDNMLRALREQKATTFKSYYSTYKNRAFDSLSLDITANFYCALLSMPGVWGGALEIKLLAEALGICIPIRDSLYRGVSLQTAGEGNAHLRYLSGYHGRRITFNLLKAITDRGIKLDYIYLPYAEYGVTTEKGEEKQDFEERISIPLVFMGAHYNGLQEIQGSELVLIIDASSSPRQSSNQRTRGKQNPIQQAASASSARSSSSSSTDFEDSKDEGTPQKSSSSIELRRQRASFWHPPINPWYPSLSVLAGEFDEKSLDLFKKGKGQDTFIRLTHVPSGRMSMRPCFYVLEDKDGDCSFIFTYLGGLVLTAQLREQYLSDQPLDNADLFNRPEFVFISFTPDGIAKKMLAAVDDKELLPLKDQVDSLVKKAIGYENLFNNLKESRDRKRYLEQKLGDKNSQKFLQKEKAKVGRESAVLQRKLNALKENIQIVNNRIERDRFYLERLKKEVQNKNEEDEAHLSKVILSKSDNPDKEWIERHINTTKEEHNLKRLQREAKIKNNEEELRLREKTQEENIHKSETLIRELESLIAKEQAIEKEINGLSERDRSREIENEFKELETVMERYEQLKKNANEAAKPLMFGLLAILRVNSFFRQRFADGTGHINLRKIMQKEMHQGQASEEKSSLDTEMEYLGWSIHTNYEKMKNRNFGGGVRFASGTNKTQFPWKPTKEESSSLLYWDPWDGSTRELPFKYGQATYVSLIYELYRSGISEDVLGYLVLEPNYEEMCRLRGFTPAQDWKSQWYIKTYTEVLELQQHYESQLEEALQKWERRRAFLFFDALANSLHTQEKQLQGETPTNSETLYYTAASLRALILNCLLNKALVYYDPQDISFGKDLFKSYLDDFISALLGENDNQREINIILALLSYALRINIFIIPSADNVPVRKIGEFIAKISIYITYSVAKCCYEEFDPAQLPEDHDIRKLQQADRNRGRLKVQTRDFDFQKLLDMLPPLEAQPLSQDIPSPPDENDWDWDKYREESAPVMPQDARDNSGSSSPRSLDSDWMASQPLPSQDAERNSPVAEDEEKFEGDDEDQGFRPGSRGSSP